LVFERTTTLLLLSVLCGPLAATTLDDPMRPPSALGAPAANTPAQGPRWTLHSTVVAAAQRSAVVNGRAVGVGDRVGGARVIAIHPGRVRLLGPEGEFTLRLRTPTIREESTP
jgi:MSHA biogenesis protein MshK